MNDSSIIDTSILGGDPAAFFEAVEDAILRHLGQSTRTDAVNQAVNHVYEAVL